LCWTTFYAALGQRYSHYKDKLAQVFALASVIAPGAGPFVFNIVTGALYDLQVEETNGNTCRGVNCYKWTMLMSCIGSVVALVITVLIIWLRKQYWWPSQSELKAREVKQYH